MPFQNPTGTKARANHAHRSLAPLGGKGGKMPSEITIFLTPNVLSENVPKEFWGQPGAQWGCSMGRGWVQDAEAQHASSVHCISFFRKSEEVTLTEG